ncbi:MAG: hypothetical protein QOF65_256 [Thermoleophilaceae bacterium]|jgi:hypothetical protein|nr:hypothetical protein [Thermoleophilaceae bacterium]MEA2435700.1 hypothetical protein [Thermoleophilaceae bacterium]
MAEVLEGFDEQMLNVVPPVTPTEVDEAAIRRQLRDQVARLESELGALFCSTYPRTGFEWNVGSRGGPRLLSLSELEELRDELATKLQHNRRMLADRTYVEEMHRCRIEEMLLEPERHKFVRVQAQDIGERGCKQWHVLPRFGPLGMLMNWWRVKISSGCPLARGLRPPLCDG